MPYLYYGFIRFALLQISTLSYSIRLCWLQNWKLPVLKWVLLKAFDILSYFKAKFIQLIDFGKQF